jgi:hypothetical protein
MTTKMGNNNNSNGNSNSSGISNAGVSVVPALGESWAHATATRLLLSKETYFSVERVAASDDNDSDNDNDDDNDETHQLEREVRRESRTCSLIKSAHRPNGTARYRILEDGIRDMADEREKNKNGTGNNKRSRTTN